MKRVHQVLWVLVLILSMQLTACGKPPEAAAEESPAHVEHLDGAQPTRVTLTEDAARRLDIQTSEVKVQSTGIVVPYASIVYDIEGHTWVYTSPEALTYLRTAVNVRSIGGTEAVVEAAIAAGTRVVMVGAEELYGSETEFEEE